MRKRTGAYRACENCGTMKYFPKNKLDRNEHFYCCPSCYRVHRDYDATSYDTRWLLHCDWCGGEMKVPKWKRDKQDHFFCCKSCSDLWQSENLTGENSPFWKGGERYYVGAKRWQIQRERVRARDKFICQDCGSKLYSERFPCSKRSLDVHHIDPNIPDPDFALDDNCVTLCSKCHHLRHIANRSNSGKPLTDNAEGNPERSPRMGERAETIPKGSRPQAIGGRNGRHPKSKDGDIVQTVWKHTAAKRRARRSESC